MFYKCSYTAQKLKFSVKDLFTFTKEILNVKLNLLCSGKAQILQNFEIKINFHDVLSFSACTFYGWCLPINIAFNSYRHEHIHKSSLFRCHSTAANILIAVSCSISIDFNRNIRNNKTYTSKTPKVILLLFYKKN